MQSIRNKTIADFVSVEGSRRSLLLSFFTAVACLTVPSSTALTLSSPVSSLERRIAPSPVEHQRTVLQMSVLTQASNLCAYPFYHYYYYTFQSVTMSAFSTVGDALAQHRDLHRASSTRPGLSFDWKRNRRFMLKGLGCGLIWSLWYKIAEYWSDVIVTWILSSVWKMSMENGAESILRTVTSMLLEQFIAAPLVYACWDLPILCLLNGRSLRTIPSVVRKKLPFFLLAHFKLWTPVNIVIYSIPIQWRIFTQSFFEIIWEAMASTIASTTTEDSDKMDDGIVKPKTE